jgi:metal-responsive CopG/Arc/MetJ family transcriptional regulator
MSGPKTTVSTPLDPDVLERLDAFCAKIHRNRAEVIRGLLYALLVEGKQFIYEDWRKEVEQ